MRARGGATGPRSAAGKRRSALNAVTHGLSRPLAATPWVGFVDPLADQLAEEEGLSKHDSLALAGLILDFERTLAHQREAYLGERFFQQEAEHAGESDRVTAELLLAKAAEGEHLGFGPVLAGEMHRFFRSMARKRWEAGQVAMRKGLRRELRYYKRAANQLFKGLKHGASLPNTVNETDGE